MAKLTFSKTAGLLEPAMYRARITAAKFYDRNGKVGISLNLDVMNDDRIVKVSDIIFDNMFESKKRSFYAVLEDLMQTGSDAIELDTDDHGEFTMLLGLEVAVDIKIDTWNGNTQNKVNAYAPVSNLE